MTNTQRVSIDKQHPAAYTIALSTEVENNAAAAGLDPLLVELVKIRTSQINGCAFCLRMHTGDALKKGENPDRIAVLPGWEETGYFSETDRAALRLTEAITPCVGTSLLAPGARRQQTGDSGEDAIAPLDVGLSAWLLCIAATTCRPCPVGNGRSESSRSG